MTKYMTTIVISILIMSLSGCTVPSASIEGRYISEVNPSAYLELQNNNQFVVNQDQAFSGTYTVSEDTVKLIYTFGSFVLVIDGDTLIDEDNERWIRE